MGLLDQPEENSLVQEAEYNGTRLRCQWHRRPNFREEARLIQGAADPATRRIDPLNLLAAVVRDFVADIAEDTGETVGDGDVVWESLGLTPERILKDLPDRPALAWFLSNWILADILAHADPRSAEAMRGKPGG